MSEWLGLDISRQDHVDGSNTLVQMLPRYHSWSRKSYPIDVEPGLDHREQIRQYFLLPRPQENIVEKFKLTTGIMQNPVTIFNIGENFALTRGREGFTKVYATLAPQYLVYGDACCPHGLLNEYWATRILLNGLREGERRFAEENSRKKFLKTHVIFAIGREVPPHESIRLVKVALQFDKEDVPAIDFVCDESEYPLQRHKDAIWLAQLEGRDVHAHAGEWVNRADEKPDFKKDLYYLMDNIRIAISLGCKTINHARVLGYSKPMMRIVADLGIGISSCPGNYLASGYIKDIRELRLKEQLEAGVKVFLDHDDDLFFPSLNEVGHMCLESGLTREHLKQMNQNAWDTRPGQV